MKNFFETVKNGLQFNKFLLEDLLFVEYSCPVGEEEFPIWSQRDYILHVLSGKKSWSTLDGTITAKAGDIVYVKKGGAILKQFFDEDFCMLVFFLTDDFIKGTVSEVKGKIALPNKPNRIDSQVTRISSTSVLTSYFQTMLHYFEVGEKPLKTLLELKFRELLISIISNYDNSVLAHYFLELSDQDQPSLPHIMEKNYRYNFSLEELAKMCHRSLSTFKRDFKKHYNTTPGKWLLSKRLDHAAILLHSESANITQIAFDCGFEDSSHFSRAFKEKFGESPLYYRKRVTHSPS